MSENALRFNKGKLDLNYIPWQAVSAFCLVTMSNSEKYGGKYPDGNYKKGAPQSEYMACALRHLAQHMTGEKYDSSDNNIPHLYKALWNICQAVEDSINHPENDDLKHITPPIDFSVFTKFLEFGSKLTKEDIDVLCGNKKEEPKHPLYTGPIDLDYFNALNQHYNEFKIPEITTTPSVHTDVYKVFGGSQTNAPKTFTINNSSACVGKNAKQIIPNEDDGFLGC
jgi:Domain of unknown function (DUF5664)